MMKYRWKISTHVLRFKGLFHEIPYCSGSDPHSFYVYLDQLEISNLDPHSDSGSSEAIPYHGTLNFK
jgi:hypothetical protein